MTTNRKFEITNASSGVALGVRIVTRTSKSEIAGVREDGVLKVRLMGAPNEEATNQELLTLLAGFLGVQKTKMEIVEKGDSPHKLVIIEDVTPEALEEKLKSLGNVEDGS